MKKFYEKHRQLIKQIELYESLLSNTNIEAINILSFVKKEIEQILFDLDYENKSNQSNNPLSAREMQVIELVINGEPNKEIAFQLNISPKTVQFHLKSIFNKLDVSSRTQAATEVLKRKLITK